MDRSFRLQKTPYALIAVLLVQLLFIVVVPALGVFDTPALQTGQGETMKGRIVREISDQAQTGPRGQTRTQVFEVDVDGQLLTIEHVTTDIDPVRKVFKPGERVLVNEAEGPNGNVFFLADHDRTFPLMLFGIAFAVLVVAIARLQGALSLLGMVLSLLVILRFIIPGIVSGNDPVIIAVLGSLAILASNLILSHGANPKTLAALLGTFVALSLTAVLSDVGIAAAHLTGVADDESATLQILTNGTINASGLLLAGVIIGALGVLDDVTVAQASAVYELRAANPFLVFKELYLRAMQIGKDHIASTVNTLFLAYAGSSLPVLIILSLSTEGTSILANREFLATEIIRTFAGTIGIVAAVPLTTLIASYMAAKSAPVDSSTPGHSHSH